MYISDDIKWERRCELEEKNLECIWIEMIQEKSKYTTRNYLQIPGWDEILAKIF